VVVVSNTAGTVTSSAATLTVMQPQSRRRITTQPANHDGDCGAGSDVTGSGGRYSALSYQWQREWREHLRRDFGKLHNAGDDDGDSESTFAVVVTNTTGTATSRQRH